MDDQSVQVSETSKDMQESDDNVVIEQPEEGTVTEVREELIEVTEDGMDLIKEDIRLVEIDGMTPTPNYLPSRITPTNLKYGNICDYRHFGLPEGKEDHRQVLLCPPSTYHYTKETGKEEPHEYYHFSRWLFWSCQNREVGTSRWNCLLTYQALYTRNPSRRNKATGIQVSTTLETCDVKVQVVPTTTISGTQTEKMPEIQRKRTQIRKSVVTLLHVGFFK